METKHTKGNWKITDEVPNGIEALTHHINVGLKDEKMNWSVAAVFTDVGGGLREAEANAKLIAAAPALLEALIEIRNCKNRLDYHSDRKLIDYVIEVSNNAINKATK